MNGGANADGFLFSLGYDTDRINTFEQDLDEIALDAMLWAGNASVVTGQDVVDTFGALNGTGTILTLTFIGGDVLEVQNAAGINALALGGDILIL